MKVFVLVMVALAVMVVNTSAFTISSDVMRKFGKMNTKENNLWTPKKNIADEKVKSMKKEMIKKKAADKERVTLKHQETVTKRLHKKSFDNMTEEKKHHVLREKRQAEKRSLGKVNQMKKKSEKKMMKKESAKAKNLITKIKNGKSHKKNSKKADKNLSKKQKTQSKALQNKKLHKEKRKNKKLVKTLKKAEQEKRLMRKTRSLQEKEERREMKKAMKKLERGQAARSKKELKLESFLLKHMKPGKVQTLLKEAKPYMKEGRTLEERRSLKAQRLRIKREAAEQTSDFLTKSFKTKDSEALHKFSEEDIEDSEEKKDSDGGYPIPDTLSLGNDLDEEEVSSGENEPDSPDIVMLPAHVMDTFSGVDELANFLATNSSAADILNIPALSEVSSNAIDSPVIDAFDEDVNLNPPPSLEELFADLDALEAENEIEETQNEAGRSTTTTLAPPPEWPWNREVEGEEVCGQARFGPETRANRGQRMLKILQGKEALPGSFPWQVAILDKDRDLLCGGTLIAPRWVMTAAHCVRKKLFVRLSEHHVREKEGFEIEQKVRRIFRHPNYNSSTIDNDIALLRLPALPRILNPSTGRRTRGVTDRACLPPTMEEFPSVGTRCLVMGWGKANAQHSFGTDVLMYTRLPLISRKACVRANRKTITENMFCAGHYKGGSDTCSGDSGGPLLCPQRVSPTEETWVVYGVTSFGDGCGNAGKMGVYARVGNYLPWIAGIMQRYL